MMMTCQPSRGPRRGLGHVVALADAILARQVIDCEVHTGEGAARHVGIARAAGAAGEQDRIEIALQVRGGDVGSDVHAGAENNAFLGEKRETAIEHPLLELNSGIPYEAVRRCDRPSRRQ